MSVGSELRKMTVIDSLESDHRVHTGLPNIFVIGFVQIPRMTVDKRRFRPIPSLLMGSVAIFYQLASQLVNRIIDHTRYTS